MVDVILVDCLSEAKLRGRHGRNESTPTGSIRYRQVYPPG